MITLSSTPDTTAHKFAFRRLVGGSLVPLADFTGKPILVVNTASKCQFTSQYEDLQALHERYAERGLIIIGVPSNDFGQQEPGTASEIGAFCQKNYGVAFTMADKERVVGPLAHPFFRWLQQVGGEDAVPRWNFHKYLIGADGQLRRYWSSVFRPTNPQVLDAIEAALV